MFVSVCDRDKRAVVPIARDIERLGFHIVATGGTARALRAAGIECEEVKKVHEGSPNVIDRIVGGEIAFMINTPFGHATRADGYELRLEAVKHGVDHVTNLSAAQAMVAGMEVAAIAAWASRPFRIFRSGSLRPREHELARRSRSFSLRSSSAHDKISIEISRRWVMADALEKVTRLCAWGTSRPFAYRATCASAWA